MRPASSSTTPNSWQTSLVFRPGTPSPPPTGGVDGLPGRVPVQTEGSQPPRSKSQERVPAGTSVQPGHVTRHPRFAPGTRRPHVCRRSASDSSDICPTCRHSSTSDSTEDDDVEAVPQKKVRNRPVAEEPPPRRPSLGPVHGHKPPSAASMAPDAKRIAHREGVRGKSARPGHAP